MMCTLPKLLESLIDSLPLVPSKAMLAASPSIYLARYPFLPTTREYVRKRGLTINDLSSKLYGPILWRAINRVELAIRYGFVNDRSRETEVEILSFPLAVFLVTCMSDPAISKRYAMAESERCSELLIDEPNQVIERIADDGFGLELKALQHVLGTQTYDFCLDFSDYVRLASHFSSPSWRLVNKNLRLGQVHLFKSEAVGILKLHAEENILRAINETGDVSPPQFLKQHLAGIKSIITVKEKEEERTTIGFSLEALPPCIRSIYNRLVEGESLSHFARFTLTSFFLNVGLTRREVLHLFSRLPDFDEHLSQYQIEHIAGGRGRVKKYTSPSCRTLQTHGLCPRTEQCLSVRSPLKRYYGQVRLTERGEA